MHSFRGYTTSIHYNSDGSGDAIVHDSNTLTEVRVPCADLVAFVAELVRAKRIAALEQASVEELIGLAVKEGFVDS